jgi:hypothetical protein
MVRGRVGSIFSDPNLMYGTAPVDEQYEEVLEAIPEGSIIEVGDSDEIYIPSEDDSTQVDNQVQLVGSDDEAESYSIESEVEID